MATYAKEKDAETVVEDDPQARATLKEVFENTARWPKGFNGFTADIAVNIDGQEESGAATVKGPKEIELSIKDENLKAFAAENLASIAMHRGPRSFDESDGKYKLTFGDDGIHPLGRSVIMNGDGMSSFYRVKDGRIQQINRRGQRFAFTINVEDSVKNPEGKYLTRKYSVFYFDPENGALKDVESYADEYARVGSLDLPQYRRVINSRDGKVSVSSMKLSAHRAL